MATDWPTKPLGRLAEIFLGLSLARRQEVGGSSFHTVSVGDIEDSTVPSIHALPSKTLLLSTEDEQRYRVREGDILVTAKGTQFKVAWVQAESAGAIIASTLILIRPGQELRSPVLYAALKSSDLLGQIMDYVRESTSTLAWHPDDISKILVPIPPMPVQQRLADVIETAERQYLVAQRAATLRREVGQLAALRVLFTR